MKPTPLLLRKRIGIALLRGEACDDGSSWTCTSSRTSSYLWSVTYGLDKFLAVGSNGEILSSSDGNTWVSRYGNGLINFFDVRYGSNKYVAVGHQGLIMTSSNLSSWENKISNISDDLWGIAYSN